MVDPHDFESDHEGGLGDITRDRWERAQRDLITTTLDFSLQQLADMVRSQRLDLDPTFQRRDRWDQDRRSRFIESFIMNLPTPPVFLHETDFGDYAVIDGKQRLSAIVDFMEGRFALRHLSVFREANGMYYRDLDILIRKALESRATLRAVILLRISDPLARFEIFHRLNTGGVALNAQEIRNGVFAGQFNDSLIRLSETPLFRRMLRIDPGISSLWREMRDVELVLRFFTLSSRQFYSASITRSMNVFMQEHIGASEALIASFERRFIDTLDAVEAAFGDNAFRRWAPQQDAWSEQRSIAIYDAQMLACEGRDSRQLRGARLHIEAGMKRLYEDDFFQRTISTATNTPSSIMGRVDLVRDVLMTATEDDSLSE